MFLRLSFFFFFQAEDGIRDRNVTGVQTCALPIYAAMKCRSASASVFAHGAQIAGRAERRRTGCGRPARIARRGRGPRQPDDGAVPRSEERRVGKEGRTRWWREEWNTKVRNSVVED